MRTYRAIPAAHTKSDDRVLENTQADFQNSDLTLSLSNPHIWGLVCKRIQTENLSDEERLISGTYSHPLLIPHIARWVSANFAVMDIEVVNNYFIAENNDELSTNLLI